MNYFLSICKCCQRFPFQSLAYKVHHFPVNITVFFRIQFRKTKLYKQKTRQRIDLAAVYRFLTQIICIYKTYKT
jgi:hypothetical protein